MNIPENLKYTRSHEWLQLLDDGAARMGITRPPAGGTGISGRDPPQEHSAMHRASLSGSGA